jgi:hypothetical protein
MEALAAASASATAVLRALAIASFIMMFCAAARASLAVLDSARDCLASSATASLLASAITMATALALVRSTCA